MLDLMISTKATEKLGMAIEDGQFIELAVDRPDAPQLVDSIFLGKVITVDQSLQAAFVDIGQPQLAYLEKNQIPEARKDREKSIESFIYEGQAIIVQVIKDAYQNKGARLTMNIALANQVFVYLPFGNYIAVSKKLSNEEGTALKAKLKDICQGEEGLIIRTQAKQYSIDELINQIQQLRTSWQEVLAIEKDSTVPETLRAECAVSDRFIRRFPFQQINQIICDQAITANQIKKRYPELKAKVKWRQQLVDYLPLPIDESIQQILNPVVQCDQGVTIEINQTEALTVIDVNSAGFLGKINRHHFAYKVNRIAADTIARQIRLRNISGIIIIDFLRMKEKKHRTKIIEQLIEAFKVDPTRTEVYGFTAVGLLELTRKRETPIHHMTFTSSRSKEVALSQVSIVYTLERELLANQDQAVIVEVTKGFRQVWDQWINLDDFLENVSSDVYFIETKGVKDYHIKRSGTEQLITEYIKENEQLNIDKIK
ncbi:ribonuclease E/G [Amphibacillus sp. Q70]|uniref:ribonuclease E/G n=1 Tax=Amphibacillus sp. Q70 TaxID=3453416 RepID=UPI003F834DD0